MKEKEILNQEISSLEEKIKFLENQKDKEIWTVTEFLTNLNIKFDKNELKKSSEEPIDIKFREVNFQVKAIYDEDRKMIKEYKNDLEKAKNASVLSESLNLREYCPRDISIQEIANLINEKLKRYNLSPEQYEKIDMLFYFNRRDYGINRDCQCAFLNDKIWERWRSISMIKNGGINFIYWARDNASNFIKTNVGKIIFKNKRS